MILYRVSNHADLAGKGGELADGRWHTRRHGQRIVYLSDHPALCLLEILVHIRDTEDLPDSYQLLSVHVPDPWIETLPDDALPADWQKEPALTQSLGNRWLASGRPALRVPSVVAPASTNCLLNPASAQVSSLAVQVVGRFPFDQRLLRH